MSDEKLLADTGAILVEAGKVLKDRFSPDARPRDIEQLLAEIKANDESVLPMLEASLCRLRPEAGWVGDEEAEGSLPAGEWWLVDPVEGNVNHIHGMSDWGVTATLIRDGEPVFAAVHLPLSGDSYAAIAGGGTKLNGEPLRVSAKTALNAALVATGQAKPHEDPETFRRIGASTAAMLGAALLVRVSVPATTILLDVAAGRIDLFWQHSQVRAGLYAGALLVQEAGGLVTDTHGDPWGGEARDFLASAPGVQAAAVAVLSTID